MSNLSYLAVNDLYLQKPLCKYNRPDFFRTSDRCSSHSSNNATGSFSTPSVDHIYWGERRVGFLSPPCLVFVGFSFNSIPICHLKNAEIFDIGVVVVLSPSEAHRLGEIFEIYVCQRKAIVVSKFALSPENCFVCFAVWLCFFRALTFTPAVKLFRFCVERFLRLCEFTTGYDRLWCSLDWRR